MKPALEHLPVQPEESFVVRKFDYAYYPTPWHFHPEYELVLVTESRGKRFIGDNICDFEAGDLAFIGPNLPHLYRNDPSYYEKDSRLRAKSVIVHFLEDSFGENFLFLPEAKPLKSLFAKSARGLKVNGETKTVLSEMMFELCKLNGLNRWIRLLELLKVLADSDELTFISNQHIQGKNETESERMNKVFEFVMRNFEREITVSEMANHVNLAENSFSRYFSTRTRKTFIAFVNEVRLNHACKLLSENQSNIAEICFQCGFNNLSNFNRQFKNVYHLSPLAYRQQYYS